jgi:hypothetical protein
VPTGIVPKGEAVTRRDRLVSSFVSLGCQASVFFTGMTVGVSLEKGLWLLAGVAIGTLALGLMGISAARREWRASRGRLSNNRAFPGSLS